MSEFSSFACYVYGRWILFTSWIYMAFIYEHYLSYVCSVFSQIWVCYSWDHGLSKRCTLFFDQMLGSYRNFQSKVEIANFEGIIRWCVQSIRIIRWYVTKSNVSPFDFVKIFIIIPIILPRFCSQDISRLNKAIVMKLSMMIDLSLT